MDRKMIVEEIILMGNRPKGVWGQNPTSRPQYQPKPRHIMPRRPEVNDGCAGVFLMLAGAVGMLSVFVYILICF